MQTTYKNRALKIKDDFTKSIYENVSNDMMNLECIEICLKDRDRIIIYPPKKLNGQYRAILIQNECEQNLLIECVNKKDLFEIECMTTDLYNDHYSRFVNSIEIPICMIEYLY